MAQRKTPTRIVNLQERVVNAGSGEVMWQEMPGDYKSSSDALKGQPKHGAGTYQRATFFDGPRTLKSVQPPLVLIEDDGTIDEPPAETETYD